MEKMTRSEIGILIEGVSQALCRSSGNLPHQTSLSSLQPPPPLSPGDLSLSVYLFVIAAKSLFWPGTLDVAQGRLTI